MVIPEKIKGRRGVSLCPGLDRPHSGISVPKQGVDVPVIVTEEQSPDSLIDIFNRGDPTLLESIAIVDRLTNEFYFTRGEVARILHKKRPWVDKFIGLKRLAPEVFSLIDETHSKENRLPIIIAIRLFNFPPKHQIVMAAAIVSKRMVSADAIKYIRRYAKEKRLGYVTRHGGRGPR